MKYYIKNFGESNGEETKEIFVENGQGTSVSFVTLGARLNRWLVPIADGESVNIVLGYDDAQHALDGRGYYYGATIGRVAGRIDGAAFTLNDRAYELEKNDGLNHLHGGSNGVDLVNWAYEVIEGEGEISVVFTHHQTSEADGYPGEMDLKVIHSFNEDSEWRIRYEAKTDQTTLFNPTNHVYFNLNGDNRAAITNHEMMVAAPHYLPLREDSIPLGEVASVDGTPFDLQNPIEFAKVLESDHPQLKLTGGFDHPFMLDTASSQKARIVSPLTDLELTMTTDQESVVIYTHNVVPTALTIWGKPLEPYAGFTLETQAAPDAINQPSLGDVTLEPEQTYTSETAYRVTLV